MPRKPYAGPIIDAHHHLWDLVVGTPSLARGAGRRARRPRRSRPDPARLSARRTIARDAAGTMSSPPSMSRPAGRPTTASARRDGSTRSTSRRRRRRAMSSMCRSIDRQRARPDRGAGGMPPCRRRARHTELDADPARRFAPRDGLMDDRPGAPGSPASRRHGLVFDLMVFPRAAARRRRGSPPPFRDQLFVLNHCGSPIDRDAEGHAGLARRASRLAGAARQRRRSRSPTSSPMTMTGRSTASRPVVLPLHRLLRAGARDVRAATFRSPACMPSFDQMYRRLQRPSRPTSPQTEQTALFFDNGEAALPASAGRRHRRPPHGRRAGAGRGSSEPNRMLRQPGEALTTVIRAVMVTSSSAPGMVPA